VSDLHQFREMVEAYALGALDGEERSAFEAHLASGCAECEQALREARWLVSQLAYLAPDSAPSQELKNRLMRTVGSEAGVVPFSPQTPKKSVPLWMWLGVAAMLLLTLYSGWNAMQLTEEVKRVQQEMTAEREKRASLEKELEATKQEAMMRAILTNPASTKIMLLPSSKDIPSLEAKWHSEMGIVVTGYQVPKLPNNHVLQLWLIPKDGSKPMPSITFWPEAGGDLAKLVTNPPEGMVAVKALAITEEPSGGSQQPTSTPIWVGSVS
jgi:anti-sigma-K factor RskA